MKYHINNKGVPSVCKSDGESCSYGGFEFHFETEEEAERYVSKLAELEFGILSGLGAGVIKCKNPRAIDYFLTHTECSEVSLDLESKDFISLLGKDVAIYYDNHILTGAVLSIIPEEHNRNITVFTPKGVEKVNLVKEKANYILASNDNYFTESYSGKLKSMGIPLYKFRYSIRDLEEMKGTYLTIEYNGFYVEGLFHSYALEDYAKIIIKTDDREYVEVKLSEIAKLEEIGKNIRDYKVFKFSRDNTVELRSIEKPNLPSGSKLEPDKILDNYLKDLVNVELGKQVDLSKYEVNWVNELETQVEETQAKFNKEDDAYLAWINELKNSYYDEYNMATSVNEYYNKKKALIDEIVDKANNFNWRGVFRRKEHGVVSVLICIYENDMIIRD